MMTAPFPHPYALAPNGVRLPAPPSDRLARDIGLLAPCAAPTTTGAHDTPGQDADSAAPETAAQTGSAPALDLRLSPRALCLLHMLWVADRPMTQRELCNACLPRPINISTVHGDVRRLEATGMVTMAPDTDRPQFRPMVITDAGRERAAAHRARLGSTTRYALLTAVRQINDIPYEKSGRWWPIRALEHARTPATADSVAAYLLGPGTWRAEARTLGKALDALVEAGVLLRATTQRRGRDVALYWHGPGVRPSRRKAAKQAQAAQDGQQEGAGK